MDEIAKFIVLHSAISVIASWYDGRGLRMLRKYYILFDQFDHIYIGDNITPPHFFVEAKKFEEFLIQSVIVTFD
jgi:hypothetical protein